MLAPQQRGVASVKTSRILRLALNQGVFQFTAGFLKDP